MTGAGAAAANGDLRWGGIEFVPMGARDIDAVLDIEQLACAFPWTRGNFADALAAGYSGWLCRVGPETAGYAVVMRVLDEAHLLNLVVAPAWQRQGLGARLLDFSMRAARQHGAGSMFLEVRPSNVRAHALYDAFGFVVIGRRKNYYPAPGGTREDALVMKHSLEARHAHA